MGSYCTNTSVQLTCPAGSYCPEGSPVPTPCSDGDYCSVSGSSAPVDCAAGFYCPGTLQQIACPAGSYCPARSAQPTPCTGEGIACPSGVSAPVPCTTCKNPGYYKACTLTATSLSCSTCSSATPGQFYTSAGLWTPSSCATGEAPLCALGQYRLVGLADAGACRACTKASASEYYTGTGNFSDACPKAAYPPCPSGFYRTNYSTSLGLVGACTPCTNGRSGQYYTGSGNLSNACPVAACPACARADQYRNCSGTVVGGCLQCAPPPAERYYAPNPADPTVCTPSSCPACPSGQYRGGCTGAENGTCQACTVCAEGEQYYARDCGLATDTVCRACTACGEWQRQTRDCYTGSVQQYSWDRACVACSQTDCAEGTYFVGGCIGGAPASCANCTECPSGSGSVTPCSPYADTMCGEMAGCRTTVNFTEYPWMTPSDRCLPGQYLLGLNPKLCAPCPDYLVGNGLWCTPCRGYRRAYMDVCSCLAPTTQLAAGACVCPEGHAFSAADGCAPCRPGYFSTGSVQLTDEWWHQNLTCLPCPAGAFNNATGATACDPCPHYRYKGPGDGACLECPTGSFALAADSAACEPCNASCPLGSLPTPCPTGGGGYICEVCPVVLPVHAAWVKACYYDCAEGYYAADNDCVPCNASLVCAPGRVRSPCTAFGDANCDAECVNETKPLANSVWRTGCEWGCEAGYAPVWTDYIMYTSAECVAEGSSWWF